MAQKSRPARKVSSNTAKPSLVAKAAAVVKAAIGGSKPAAKVASKATAPAKSAKPTPKTIPVKTAPAKAAPAAKAAKTPVTKAPAKAAKAAKAAPAVEKSAEPQIAKAKAALKKESTDAAKPEAKRSRKISIDISPNEAAGALSSKWNTLYKKAEQIEAKPYNMKGSYEEKTAITHKVLGWGYILANRNDRLEVLFKDGIKYLISNYKP